MFLHAPELTYTYTHRGLHGTHAGIPERQHTYKHTQICTSLAPMHSALMIFSLASRSHVVFLFKALNFDLKFASLPHD